MVALDPTLRSLLEVAAKRDIVAPFTHMKLTLLEQHKLVESHYLYQPNGRVAKSKRWTLTDAGRVAYEASR